MTIKKSKLTLKKKEKIKNIPLGILKKSCCKDTDCVNNYNSHGQLSSYCYNYDQKSKCRTIKSPNHTLGVCVTKKSLSNRNKKLNKERNKKSIKKLKNKQGGMNLFRDKNKEKKKR